MSRVLFRAGQFAHVKTKEIDRVLSDLYCWNYRKSVVEEDNVEAAVPSAIYKMYRAGKCEQLFDGHGTISFVGERLGLLCPLCRAVGRGSFQRVAFTRYVSPSFLHCPLDEWDDPDPEDADAAPLHWDSSICRTCGEVLHRSRLDWRMTRGKRAANAQICSAMLAYIVAHKKFAERVMANRDRRLRFDPRFSPHLYVRQITC